VIFVIQVTATEIRKSIVTDKELGGDPQMKPRSTVTALLAITESLLAARAAKAKRTKPVVAKRTASRAAKISSLLLRPLWLRIKTAS
jgi:hypothetical protein